MAQSSDLGADLELAQRMADAARAISLERFRGVFERRIKSDGSIVTEVDEAVEDALRALVRSERPGDAFLGEERGEAGEGPRRWIVDAIDGTQSFADGTTGWGTLIGLEIEGHVVLGVCEQSPLDRRYWATKGHGAYSSTRGATAERLRVGAASALDAARVFVPPPQWLRTEAVRAKASALLSAGTRHAHTEHPALEVAMGVCDVAVFFMAGPWDLAAPAIIVEEAGGQFSDLAGGRTLTNGALFSNGALHAAALRYLTA